MENVILIHNMIFFPVIKYLLLLSSFNSSLTLNIINIIFYSQRQKYCCNPYHSHGSCNKGPEISSSYAKENKKLNLIPGKKLCLHCQARVKAGELTKL